MYKDIIERDKQKRLLLDKNNWRWELSFFDRPAYYIDSQGLEDAVELVKTYIGDMRGILITLETDHRDATKKLVVLKFPFDKGGIEALYRLIHDGKVTSDLNIAWITKVVATKILSWVSYPDIPNSIECVILVGHLNTDWSLKAVKSQRKKVLCFLQEKMGVPTSGRLYLDYNRGNPHLIWHSCTRCDQPLSIMERLFGNWWGRHIPDQWSCEWE